MPNSWHILRETGSGGLNAGCGRPSKRTFIHENPKSSISLMVVQTNLSYGICQLSLKRTLHHYAYKLYCSHELLPVDFSRRVEFYQWFQNNLNSEDIFDTVFFLDQAFIFLDMLICGIWQFRHRKIVIFCWRTITPKSSWLGWNISKKIGGFYFFEGTLTAAGYRDGIIASLTCLQ